MSLSKTQIFSFFESGNQIISHSAQNSAHHRSIKQKPLDSRIKGLYNEATGTTCSVIV
jgi:hypothetical protein